jgi:hypothetical protein
MSYPHPHNFFLIVKKEFFECMDASVLPGFWFANIFSQYMASICILLTMSF